MSKSKKSKGKVDQLLRSAHAEGKLSVASLKALTIVDLGAQIQAGLGVGVDDVAASEVVLVTLMPDDSSSIKWAGNAALVREGHNLVLKALAASNQKDDVLVHTRYLNGHVLYPYVGLDDATTMTKANYDPHLGTPLYDQSVVLLGTVVAKAQELEAGGVPVRTVTLIITDGGDYASTRAKARDVRALVEDMRKEENHIVAALGVDDGTNDFRKIFKSMGIEDRWILTPKSTPEDIRKAFQVFSQSAVRASQAATFSKTAVQGFLH